MRIRPFLILLLPLSSGIAAQAQAVDYDIVYVRQPRFGDNTNTLWPEVFHPARLDPGADLMLLHPDGSEEVLVLWLHADLKIAIPTSVVLMAFTSVVGISYKLAVGDVQPGTFENWLAAAPVVAVGAPFGALVVSKVGRKPTLVVVSALCVIQFLWTLIHERAALTAWNVSAALLGVGLFLLIFQDMYRHGHRLGRRKR